MENFNALLTLNEIKTLYSGKPVGICPLYKGVLNVPKTFEATGNPIVLPEYKSLVKLTTKFSPKQAGTGDPSPENVRPISGWDSVTVNVRGKNLITLEHGMRGIYGYVLGATSATEYAVLLVNGATYTLSFDAAFTLSSHLYCESETMASPIRIGSVYSGSAAMSFTVNFPTDLYSIYLYNSATWTEQPFKQWQLEFGSTPTPYEPYQGTTATLTLPETIYGGTVDAVTGKGSKTWGFIASYNGEPLPGEWISDRDVYAPGTTPTTGAQVAYKLATPEPFEVSQFSIPSLRGENYFFTTGEKWI